MPTPRKNQEPILIKDHKGRVYRQNPSGMVVKVSVEEGIVIEEELSRLSIPKPYIDFNRDKQRS